MRHITRPPSHGTYGTYDTYDTYDTYGTYGTYNTCNLNYFEKETETKTDTGT